MASKSVMEVCHARSYSWAAGVLNQAAAFAFDIFRPTTPVLQTQRVLLVDLQRTSENTDPTLFFLVDRTRFLSWEEASLTIYPQRPPDFLRCVPFYLLLDVI